MADSDNLYDAYIGASDDADELFISGGSDVPGYGCYCYDDLFRRHFMMLCGNGKYADTIVDIPCEEVLEYAKTIKRSLDEDGFDIEPQYDLSSAEEDYKQFMYAVDKCFSPKRVALKAFPMQSNFHISTTLFGSFLHVPTLKYKALNYLIKRQYEAFKLHEEMKQWKGVIIHAYTNQKLNNEARYKAYLKTIDGYDENTAKWIPKIKASDTIIDDMFCFHKKHTTKEYNIIDTYVITDGNEEYLSNRYFRLAIVFGNGGINIDDEIAVTTKAKSVAELVKEKYPNRTQVKVKRMWRDLHFEDDKVYYNYGTKNSKKEYLTIDDVEKLEFR